MIISAPNSVNTSKSGFIGRFFICSEAFITKVPSAIASIAVKNLAAVPALPTLISPSVTGTFPFKPSTMTTFASSSGISYTARCYQIEPDISAACYFYAAAALTGGRTVVKNVTWECMQGDLKFLELLSQMGCIVNDTPDGIEIRGIADSKLKGTTVDMKDFSDQAMTLAALAPFVDSTVRIENIGHIRLQESDRIHAIVTELLRLGISCEEEQF